VLFQVFYREKDAVRTYINSIGAVNRLNDFTELRNKVDVFVTASRAGLRNTQMDLVFNEFLINRCLPLKQRN
jgi:hypothetical protein